MTVRVDELVLRDLLACGVAPVLTNFINTAHVTTDNFLLGKLPEEVLTLIETYLAAHFYTLTVERGALQDETVGDVRESFHNVYKGGFNSTRFGQQALIFDNTGTLSRESARSQSTVGFKSAQFRLVKNTIT